jgi:hypothetical protein
MDTPHDIRTRRRVRLHFSALSLSLVRVHSGASRGVEVNPQAVRTSILAIGRRQFAPPPITPCDASGTKLSAADWGEHLFGH